MYKIEEVLKDHPPFRLKQACRAVFVDMIETWDEATSLSKAIRDILKHECPLDIKARIGESQDRRTAKAAVFLGDGKAVEAVLMSHKDGRNTVCVSSQIGCSLGCDFCASGKLGFKRNLSADEIVSQVLFFARYLKKSKQKINNVVFMGIGEPFLNYDEVMRAVRAINNKDKLNVGARRISISTVGIVEGIEKLSSEPLQVNLAVSLHSADEKLRDRLMPVNKRYPIKKVLAATASYIGSTNRRVMIEYLMLKGINDSTEDAKKLVRLLKTRLGKLYFVNLISYNPTEKYDPAPFENVKKFKKVLEASKISVTQRYRFGRDIEAACGQLAARNISY